MLSFRQKGFTLIESIVTIIIVGIISATVSMIIGNYLENYDATSRRTILQTSAQLAIERISREVRNALPNSICTPNPTGTACLPSTQNIVTFIKVKDAGYYQDKVGVYPDGVTAFAALAVNPDPATTLIDILSGTDLRAQVNDYVVVYNINNSAVYTGNNLAIITTVTPMNVDAIAGDDIIRLTIDSSSFPLHSPQRRIHIVEPNATIFYLNNNNLMLGKSHELSDPLFNRATSANSYLLLENVNNVTFSFNSGSQQRSGLLHIDLTVEDEGEQIHIIHEAHIYNVP